MRMEHTFGGMGTRIVLRGRRDGVSAARRRFEEVEGVASRFLPGSALRQVNRDRRSRVPVGGDLEALLGAAAEIRDRTGGLVDPAVGRMVVAWGYDRDFPDLVEPAQEPDGDPPGAWAVAGGVVERRPGTVLDLGGVAKGWTCDRVVESGAVTFASAGGDLRSAEPDLVVEVRDPWDEVAATVPVGVGALATSSIARRRWRAGGTDAHHLVDPRTGRPADTPVLSASVVAATALEAEAGAKAVLLLGAGGLAWADRQPWIRRAIVVWAGGSVYGTAA
ncbi:MAG: FAD:protein FMN transferase [Acidimicrobiia bacterium]|nr:FAD:protein FMN transferase [Acidimicrobiia bacterium]